MLKSLDILIGLSVVMLIVSMAVTLITQAILNMLASRANNLRDGLADILELLDAGMTRKEAEAVARKALLHPIIGGKVWAWIPSWLPTLRFFVQIYKRGNVIHREEFVKILLGFGASYQCMNNILTELENNIEAGVAANARANIDVSLKKLKVELENIAELAGGKFENLIRDLESAADAAAQQPAFSSLRDAISEEFTLFETLTRVLKENGIENAADTLKNVRVLALEYEKSHPELANDVRQTNALLQEASSEFLAKINVNFDQVMDRVIGRFTSTTRVVTFISATLVAVVLQLDTIYIMNRLSIDDALRDSFVKKAANLVDNPLVTDAVAKSVAAELAKKEAEEAENAAKDAKSSNSPDAADKEKAAEAARTQAESSAKAAAEANNANKENTKENLAFLASEGLINFPTSWSEWQKKRYDNKVNYVGVFISILLLSLGAPFWYNVLGKFLQLRSLLAQKDDEQKNIRQSTQAAGTASPQNPNTPTSPNPLQGERGDLNAVG